MRQAAIAVVIPVYNHVKFIEKAVRSVLTQSYRPSEIIVIDDNSTDGTYQVLERFRPAITLLRKPENVPRGPAASQNLAIQMTACQYIAFLDSDDLWMPEKLARQVAVLEANLDIDLCYCNGVAIDENDRHLYQILESSHREADTPNELLLDCYIVSPSKVMVRRELFDQVGLFREDLLFSHDHEMWLRMREATKFAYVPELLMCYRRHSQQFSRRREMWESGFHILREAARRYPYGIATYRKRWAVLRYRMGECYWRQKDAVPAVYNFVLSALADPRRATDEILRRMTRRLQRRQVQQSW